MIATKMEINKYHPIVFLSIAFALGVFLGFKSTVILALFVPSVLAVICFIVFRNPLFCLSLIIFLFLGFGLANVQQADINNNPLKAYSQKEVAIEGLIASDVVKKNTLYGFKLNVKKLNGRSVNLPAIAYCQNPKLRFGHLIRAKTKIKENDDPNKEVLLFLDPKPQIIGKNNFWYSVGKLREWIKNSLQANKSQAAAFSYAMLTGQTSELNIQTKADLTASGLAHIWSVSGLHVGFLVLLILRIFRVLHLRSGWQLICAGLVLILFSAFTGFDPPVIRASIMAIWLCSAYLLGRKNNWLPSLATAALITLAIDPLALFEASFQLSYAAIASLFIFTSKIGNSPLAAGISAQALPLPFIIYYYGQLPLFSPIANLLAIPLAAIAFYLIIFALILKLIGLDLVIIPNFASELILKIGSFFSNLPLSTIEVSPLILLLLIGLVIAVIVFIRRQKIYLSLSYAIIGLLLIFAIGQWYQVGSYAISGPSVTVEFLDVGQGDSSLITGPNNERILIDSGKNPYLILRHLVKRKIRNLDLIVATHADSDHIGSFSQVLSNFKVKAILANGFPSNSYIYRALLSKVKQNHVRYLVARQGQNLEVGSLRFNIIGPAKGFIRGSESDDNNNSVVMRMSFGKNSFLFTGDAGFSEEAKINGMVVRTTVLKVSHHGSTTGTSALFLKLARPKIAVISAGKNNMYGHPKTALLRRLINARAKIYRTDLTSDIKIIATKESLKVYD